MSSIFFVKEHIYAVNNEFNCHFTKKILTVRINLGLVHLDFGYSDFYIFSTTGIVGIWFDWILPLDVRQNGLQHFLTILE